MRSELTLTYSSSDSASSENSSSSTSLAEAAAHNIQPALPSDSSTNLLNLTGKAATNYTTEQDDLICKSDGIGAGSGAPCENNNNSSNSNFFIMMSVSQLASGLFHRLLYQTVLADKLSHHSNNNNHTTFSSSSSILHILLSTILTNGHYAFVVFLLFYITLLLLFILPLNLLSKLLTEFGVYTLLLTSVVYIGRCVLRLLAFPGTNVRVYGEIEVEFAKYS
eukprot:scaffold122543_cov66-Cyclotella_meneghiniana.AAC.1